MSMDADTIQRSLIRLRVAILWVAVALSLTGVGQTAANDRASFLAAERALRSGDLETYGRLSAELTEYPLYPYLRFAELTRDLESTPDAEIEDFLDRFGHTPFATRLRLAYLARLAAAQRWSDYARVYRPDDSTERRCHYLRALIETGRRDEALAQVAPIWLSASSRPDACDPVFAAWRAAGGMTAEQVNQRLRLAMEAGNSGLARALLARLPAAEHAYQSLWLAIDADPSLILDPARLDPARPPSAAMLAHGLVKLARQSPLAAADALTTFGPSLATDPAAADRAHAAVGAALTRIGDARGLALWDGLRATPDTLPEQEERLRAAIAQEAWERVLDWIARMPDGPVKRDRWLYWQGRAEAALGQASAAHETLGRAAMRRSLWAFLAADRLDLPYRLEQRGTPAQPARIRALMSSPTLARMRELARLGRDTDMRREWRELIRDLERPDLMAAAYIADVMGWHDQAIQALAKADYWDDLTLRFPLAHRPLIAELDWSIGLETDWIFAIIRQESAFATSLASHAGAIGLMQLLPATAREVAAAADLAAPARHELLDPRVNIALGSAYLARLRDRFGHVALATAAYNAGPSRVMRWLPASCLDADRWILSIPFSETRRYVERVLAYRVIYTERLGLTQTRVSDWLPPVPSAEFFRS